jgi:THO complex subunit 3
MIGPVRSVSFSFDGSYVVGGSDEGTGLEIAHVETGEYVYHVETAWPAPCVQWHPSRYVLAYSGDVAGLKIIGAMGGL